MTNVAVIRIEWDSLRGGILYRSHRGRLADQGGLSEAGGGEEEESGKGKRNGCAVTENEDPRFAANPRQRPGTEANFRAESMHPWYW